MTSYILTAALVLIVIWLIYGVISLERTLLTLETDFYNKAVETSDRLRYFQMCIDEKLSNVYDTRKELKKQKEIIAELCNYVYKDN